MRRIGRLFLLVVLASGFVWEEVVEIPDSNLRIALERKALGRNAGDAITKEDLTGSETFQKINLATFVKWHLVATI